MGAEVSTTTWYYGEMPVSVVFSGTNTISNADTGLWIEQNPTPTTATTSVSISGLALIDNTTGMEINGGTVTLGSGNSITGGTTGMVIDNQTTFTDPYPSSTTEATTSTIASNTLGNLSFSGQKGNYITLADGALAGQTINATGATFDGQGASVSGTTLAQFYAIEDKITDYLDDPTLGYVSLNASNVYVTQASESPTPGAIQRGVNVAPLSDGTVNVEAGTYTGNLTISKPLTLAGAGQTGADATTIIPSFAGAVGGSTFAAGCSNLILVQSSNVTIEDLLLDGNNPSLAGQSGATTVNGINVDAQNGIVTDYRLGTPFSNFVVHDTTVQNIDFRGIYDSDGGTFDIYNNTVTNVEGDPSSVAIFNYGGAGTFQNNNVSYANDAISANWSTGTQFLDNVITNSGSGIHTDNSSGGDLIKGNQVSDGTAGSYGIWVFVPYADVTVSNNQVTDCDVGLALMPVPAARSPSPETRSTTPFSDRVPWAPRSPPRRGTTARCPSRSSLAAPTPFPTPIRASGSSRTPRPPPPPPAFPFPASRSSTTLPAWRSTAAR